MNELLIANLGDVKVVDKRDGYFDFAVNVFFENGYGASVIKFPQSFVIGYELAVITGDEEDWGLCYSTEITDGVIHHLTEDEVMEILHRIKNLKE